MVVLEATLVQSPPPREERRSPARDASTPYPRTTTPSPVLSDLNGDGYFFSSTPDGMVNRLRAVTEVLLRSLAAGLSQSASTHARVSVRDLVLSQRMEVSCLMDLVRSLTVFRSTGDLRFETVVRHVLLPWDGRDFDACVEGRVKPWGAGQDSLIYCSPGIGPYRSHPSMQSCAEWWGDWEVTLVVRALTGGYVHASLPTRLSSRNAAQVEDVLVEAAANLATMLGLSELDGTFYLTEHAVRAAALWSSIGARERVRTSALMGALQRLTAAGLFRRVIPHVDRSRLSVLDLNTPPRVADTQRLAVDAAEVFARLRPIVDRRGTNAEDVPEAPWGALWADEGS